MAILTLSDSTLNDSLINRLITLFRNGSSLSSNVGLHKRERFSWMKPANIQKGDTQTNKIHNLILKLSGQVVGPIKNYLTVKWSKMF